MSTRKESPENSFDPHKFADVITKHQVFTVPKLIDICVLFAKNNQKLVAKMVESIFSLHNKFWRDLERFANDTLCQILASLARQCGYDVTMGTNSPKKLHAASQGNLIKKMSLSEVKDILDYLSDLSLSLLKFFEVFPQGATAFFQDGCNFLQVFSSFYEHLSVGFGEFFKMTSRSLGEKEEKQMMRIQWNSIRIELVKILRKIIEINLLSPLIDSSTPQTANPPLPAKSQLPANKDDIMDLFFQVMSLIVGERHLAKDYDKLFPFNDDCDVIAQLPGVDVDQTRVEFMREGLCSVKMKTARASGGQSSLASAASGSSTSLPEEVRTTESFTS